MTLIKLTVILMTKREQLIFDLETFNKIYGIGIEENNTFFTDKNAYKYGINGVFFVDNFFLTKFYIEER
jgi:hypothetical protein